MTFTIRKCFCKSDSLHVAWLTGEFVSLRPIGQAAGFVQSQVHQMKLTVLFFWFVVDACEKQQKHQPVSLFSMDSPSTTAESKTFLQGILASRNHQSCTYTTQPLSVYHADTRETDVCEAEIAQIVWLGSNSEKHRRLRDVHPIWDLPRQFSKTRVETLSHEKKAEQNI